MKSTKVVYFVLGVLIVGGILVELIARMVLGLGNPQLWEAHPRIEYLAKPDQEVKRFGNRMYVNAYGMRSHSFDVQAKAGELRILCFGDSIVHGGSQIDQGELATSLLRVELEKRSGESTTIGNVSAKSWGPGNWLAYAKDYGFFSADIIILVLSSHDYGDNPSFRPLDENTHPTKTPFSALYEGMMVYLPRYLPFKFEKEKLPALNAEQLEAKYATGRKDLIEFLELAQASSQHVLVFHHLEKKELKSGRLSDGGEEILAVVEEAGLTPISLKPDYSNRLSAGQSVYLDGIHLNQDGQACLAEAMLTAVQSLN